METLEAVRGLVKLLLNMRNPKSAVMFEHTWTKP